MLLPFPVSLDALHSLTFRQMNKAHSFDPYFTIDSIRYQVAVIFTTAA